MSKLSPYYNKATVKQLCMTTCSQNSTSMLPKKSICYAVYLSLSCNIFYIFTDNDKVISQNARTLYWGVLSTGKNMDVTLFSCVNIATGSSVIFCYVFWGYLRTPEYKKTKQKLIASVRQKTQADQNALGNIYSCTVQWPKAVWTGNSMGRVINVNHGSSHGPQTNNSSQ